MGQDVRAPYGDEQYGDENRTTLQGWLDAWTPQSVTAARLLQPIWSQARVKVSTFAEAQAAAKNRIAAICSEVDLRAPA